MAYTELGIWVVNLWPSSASVSFKPCHFCAKQNAPIWLAGWYIKSKHPWYVNVLQCIQHTTNEPTLNSVTMLKTYHDVQKKSIASAVWTRHYADTKTSGSVRRCFCSGLFFFSVIWVKLQMSKWTLSHTPSLSNEYPLSFFCRISRSPLIKPGKTMRLKCKRFSKNSFISVKHVCLNLSLKIN